MNEINEVPEGWELVRLGEIANYINGKAFKPTEWSEYGLPIIRIQNLNRENSEFNYCNFAVDDKYYVNKGDLLFAWSGTPDTSFGAHIWLGGRAVLNQHIFKISINNAIISKQYYLHVLNSKVKEFVSKSHGTAGLAHITKNTFEQSQIPLPPLHEQHRIVAKIEELFSSLDKGNESLKTAQEQLKIYRQAVLKWAFEGKLTNDDVKEGELHEGWDFVKLGDIADMCLGKMLDKGKNSGTLQPYLRNISVRWGSFNLADLEKMRFEVSEKERYGLKEGDLVICEGGEPGRCAIWTSNQQMFIQKALHRVRLQDNFYVKYIFHYMFYLASNGQLEKYFTGTTIKHLTGRELKKVIIYCPLSLAKQQSIVAEIESRLSVCDKLEESINQSLRQAEALRQSILKKAFEGKLVPQDPDDEPASVLLKRIQAERETNIAVKNSRVPNMTKLKKQRG